MKPKPLSLLILFFIFFLFNAHSQENGAETDEYYLERSNLIEALFPEKNDTFLRLKEAFLNVRRDLYIEENYKNIAYENIALPSQLGLIHPEPQLIVDILKEAEIKSFDKVLLLGGNTQYICAIISKLTGSLFALDKHNNNNKGLSYFVKKGIIYKAWIKEAPFDVIIVFGSIKEIPVALTSQLKEEGKIISSIHSDSGSQILISIKKYDFSLKTISSSYIHEL